MLHGIPKILIVRLSAIGDVVRVAPALHMLRTAFPHAQIDWAVEPKSAAILEDHLELDEVLVFERPEGRWNAMLAFVRFLKSIRAGQYDIVIDYHGLLKSGLITWASGAPERYGFARPRSREGSYIFTNRKVKLGEAMLNRIEENLQLTEALASRRPSLDMGFTVPEGIQTEVERYFEETFHSGKIVVALHVPVDRKEKAWPLEHFAALSDMLQRDGRFEAVLTWGPGQFEAVQEVAQKARSAPTIAPEMASLKQYMWFIHCADLYCGGDTGPMHLAWAMGTSVVALFGGTDPRRHEPGRPPFEILTAESVGLGDTNLKGLSGEEKLALITPEAVYDACVRLSTGDRA